MKHDVNIRQSKARFPLRIMVPLVLMGFVTAATFLSLYVGRQHVAENVLGEAVRDLTWQATRLQTTLERAAIAGDSEGMQEAISAQGGNPRCKYAALVDENRTVISSMRVADVGKTLEESVPDKYANIERIDSQQLSATRDSLAGNVFVHNDNTVVGVHAVVLGAPAEALRPTLVGNLIIINDISAERSKAFHGVNRQALIFFSLLTLFTAGLGIFFHLAVARRLRCLMQVAEQVTQGQPVVRSGVRGNDEVGHLAAAVDEMISTNARAEKALRDREERLQAILNAAVDAIITIDQQGIIVGVNTATTNLFGYTESELVGQNVKILMPPPYREEHDGYLARYLETGTARIIGNGREVVGQRKDGRKFPVDLSVSKVENLDLFTGIVRDISERKKLQRDVLSIAEDEQRRIGQDLHDGTQQELAGMGMLAQTLLENLSKTSDKLDDAQTTGLRELATKVVNGIARTYQEVQAISRGLVPVMVDTQGLKDALGELAARTDDLEGVTCAFKCEQSSEVADSLTATHLYRIAQEATTNALKHGRPEHVLISLESDQGQPMLQIADDGTGFDPIQESEGMGLKSMRYRASLIGASVTVTPVEAGGTLVTCRLSGGDNIR